MNNYVINKKNNKLKERNLNDNYSESKNSKPLLCFWLLDESFSSNLSQTDD